MQFKVVLLGAIMIGTSMAMQLDEVHQEAIQPVQDDDSQYAWKKSLQPVFPRDRFLALVTTERLDHEALKNEQNFYSDINGSDKYGRTPLHFLVRRIDATIDDVKGLIAHGANVLALTNEKIPANKLILPNQDIYRYGIRIGGKTPGHFYIGNEKVMRYVFGEILIAKLEKMIPREMERREKFAQEREFRKKMIEILGFWYQRECIDFDIIDKGL